jgi:hypothetical protein
LLFSVFGFLGLSPISFFGLNSPRYPLFVPRVVKSYRRLLTFGLPIVSPESSFNRDTHFRKVRIARTYFLFPNSRGTGL